MLINKHAVRGLFIVSVTSFVPDQKVELRYAVIVPFGCLAENFIMRER